MAKNKGSKAAAKKAAAKKASDTKAADKKAAAKKAADKKAALKKAADKKAALKKAADKKAKAAEKAAKAKAAKKKTNRAEVAAEAWASPRLSSTPFTDALRVGPDFMLADVDPGSTPGFDGDKEAGESLMAELQQRLGDLQERLYAESKGGGNRSVLLVVQGMDTSGKGGIMRHVVGSFDPQGVKYTAFKAPTPEERAHPFLWRIRNALPHPGQVGVFDRSQYEDVLIVRVHNFVPRATWARRYAQINAFERRAAADGATIVKVMLHIGQDEQKARLMERLDRPDKNWKFNPGDIDERQHWAAYQEAYQAALTKCSTAQAPWFVVPANRKWYARLAVTNLVLEALTAMDPQWPSVDFDVTEQRERLAAT